MVTVIAHANEPLAIAARQVPSTAKLSLKVGGQSVKVPLTFVRGAWVFVASFPDAAAVPPGQYQASLPSAAGTVALDLQVQAGPSRHRVLVPALQKPQQPFTVLILANPRFRVPGGAEVPDPILASRARFTGMVRYVLDDLLNRGEDLLSQRDDRGLIQFETLFDAALAGDARNCLVQGGIPADPRLALVQTAPLKALLDREGLAPDVVYIVHDMADHPRPSGVPALDRMTGPTRSFVIDGVTRTMGAFTERPGAVALSAGADQSLPTAMHEFGHAASEATCGWITDLYEDRLSVTPTTLNKKRRALLTDPVPQTFGVYAGRSFLSASDRWPGKGYATASYFPARVEIGQPNLMDNYPAASDKRRCRFDHLTAAWLADRLDFKMAR